MLKRKKPLKAKKGFKKKKVRLNAFAKSKIKLQNQYKSARIFYLHGQPNCEICNRPADDIHHKKGRGKYLCDISTFMATCRLCHNYIHDNPAWAREKGYLIYEFEKNLGKAGQQKARQDSDQPRSELLLDQDE